MNPARFAATTGGTMIALPDVLKITGYGRSAAYVAMADLRLPRPVKVGRSSRWLEDEVRAVQAAIARGDDVGARQALVRQLLVQRGAPPLRLLR